MQNTCKRLVQIASHAIHQDATLIWKANIKVVAAFLLKWFSFKSFVLVLRYNKTKSDWCHRSSLKIFCPWFVKCFPHRTFGLKETLYKPVAKILKWLPRSQSLFVWCSNKWGPQLSAVNFAKFRKPVHKIPRLTKAKLSKFCGLP